MSAWIETDAGVPEVPTGMGVALLVSAWIETGNYNLCPEYIMVALLVSAWIETIDIEGLSNDN